MKNILTLGLLILTCFALSFNFINAKRTIRVAVAANLSYPFQKIKESFEKSHPQVNVEIISASSGKLTAQIRHHAPFHIFISANMEYPQNLYDNHIATETPVVIAYGNSSAWIKSSEMPLPRNTEEITALLMSDKIKSIAIAEPELAPYGKVAQQWLRENGIWDAVNNKLVYGENVGKVNQYIYSETVDFAFTATSAKFFNNMNNKGKWLSLDNSVEIPHGGMILNHGITNETEVSRLFFDYLSNEKTRQILTQFGYETSFY